MLPARPLFLTLCLGFSCALAATLPAAHPKSAPPAPSPAPAATPAAPTPSWISKITPWKRTKATPPPATPPAPVPSPAPKPAAKPSKAAKPATKPSSIPVAPPTPEPIATPPASPSWIARLTPWKRDKTAPAPAAPPAIPTPPVPQKLSKSSPKPTAPAPPEPIATLPASPSWIARLTPWKRDKATPAPVAPPAIPTPPATQKLSKSSPKPTAPAQPEPIATPPASPSWIARLTPWKRDKTTPSAPTEPSTDSPKPSLLSGPLAAIRKLRSDPSESLTPPEKIERPKDWQDRFIVADPKTALYEFGPSQPGGPDDSLPRGTVVVERSRKRGWSLIEANGRSGYVDSQSLRQAERADFSDPPPPPAPKPMMATSGSGVPWRPAAPPPDLPDEAPMMDLDGALDLLPPLIKTP